MIYEMIQYIKRLFGRNSMKLNKDKLINSINQKWLTKNCPMCGKNNWNIDDDMMTMISVGKDHSIQIGNKIIPVVTITCKECGNTIFVNPLAINCMED